MDILKTILRLLTFKMTRKKILTSNKNHFIAGLLGTWIVRIGSYWNDNGASLLLHFGLGSVIYIFALSAFIWLLLKQLYIDIGIIL